MNSLSKRLVCLVSVGNPSFTHELLESYSSWARSIGCPLVCCLLDRPEIYNLMAFEALGRDESAKVASAKALQLLNRLELPEKVIHQTFDELGAKIGYDKRLKEVNALYDSNGRFRRHCLNQTFSNLLPRFRRIGVSHKNDPKVHVAVRYLIEEIALKIALFEDCCFRGEIMPHAESQLILSIYRGRYLTLRPRNEDFLIVWHNGSQADVRAIASLTAEDVQTNGLPGLNGEEVRRGR